MLRFQTEDQRINIAVKIFLYVLTRDVKIFLYVLVTHIKTSARKKYYFMFDRRQKKLHDPYTEKHGIGARVKIFFYVQQNIKATLQHLHGKAWERTGN